MKRVVFLAIAIAVAVAGLADAQTPPTTIRANQPLMENVTVTFPNTAVFRIITVDGQPQLEFERNGRMTRVGNDPVCVSEKTPSPNISFDNLTPIAWRIRLLPPASTTPNTTCHDVQCSRNLGELRVNGLCDDGMSTNDRCVTSAAQLARCYGPECDEARAKCQLTGGRDANSRTCSLAVADLIKACEGKRCGRAVEVAAFEADDGNYMAANVGRASDEGVSRPSGSFPPETLVKPPYQFTLEQADGNGTRLGVTVTTGTTNCMTLVNEENNNLGIAVVPLDNTGVGSWQYLNPRNPACLGCDGKGVPALAFTNRTGDRTFTVSIDFPAEVQPALSNQCTPGKACKVSRTVAPFNATVFDAAILSLVPKDTLLKFQVDFFDETEKVSNPIAYLRVDDKLDVKPIDAKGDLQTGFAASIGGSLDPFIPANNAPAVFTDNGTEDEAPDGKDDATGYDPCYLPYSQAAEPALCAGKRVYDGKYARHYTGSARIELSKSIGIADFTASVNYRTSDFGVDDGNVVKLSEYGVNVVGVNGLTFRFGRTLWANPANGIAIFEKGDGYRLSWRNYSIAHVIKRESDKAPANPANNDHRSFIGQVKALPIRLGEMPFLRGLKLLDVTAVYGQDKPSHDYRTWGGELSYAYTNLGCGRVAEKDRAACLEPPDPGEPRKNWGHVTGSLAMFHSSRHAESNTAPEPRHGKGWVGLLTTTWTPTRQKNAAGATEAVRSYTLLYGRGSSDAPDTTNEREDYVGESASFAANTMLMSTFLGKTDVKGRPIIGSSLANKTLLGFQVVWNTFSPLQWIARGAGVEGDVAGKTTTFRARQFKFGRVPYDTTGDKLAAREYALETTIEVPKGVKITIGGGYMQTGKALDPVIGDDAWFVTSGISLRL